MLKISYMSEDISSYSLYYPEDVLATIEHIEIDGILDIDFKSGYITSFRIHRSENLFSTETDYGDDGKLVMFLIRKLEIGTYNSDIYSTKFNVRDFYAHLTKGYKEFKQYYNNYISLYTLKKCEL